MFYNLLFSWLVYYFLTSTTFADLENDMLPTTDIIVADYSASGLDWLILYIKDSIFSFLMVISIWVFIYVWYKLVVARWSEEEYKKALQTFVYAVVWIVFVSLAWVAVKFVSGLNF